MIADRLRRASGWIDEATSTGGALRAAQDGVGVHPAGGAMRTIRGIPITSWSSERASRALGRAAPGGPRGEVTVVERGDVPGGRVGSSTSTGTGSTPARRCSPCGPDRRDLCGRRRIHRRPAGAGGPSTPPTARSFADGSTLDVHSDRDAMAAEVERLAGPQQAQGYLRLRDWLARCIKVEFDGFIASNFDSPLSLLTPQLARLAALGGFRRWDRVVSRFITDLAAAPHLHLPGALRGGSAPAGARRLRRHRLHGHHRGCVLSARRHAGAARRAGRRRRRRRCRIPLRRNGYRGWIAATTASGPWHTDRGERIHADAVDAHHRAARHLSAAGPHARAGCCRCGRPRPRSSPTSAADRVPSRNAAPPHSFRRRLGADVPRHHR